MNITNRFVCWVLSALAVTLCPNALAGITWVPLGSDVQTPANPLPAGTTTTTLTLPPISYTIGGSSPGNFTRQLKNDEPISRAYSSTEAPINTLWLSQTPAAGTVIANGQQSISFTFVAPFLPSVSGTHNLKYTYTSALATEPHVAILEINLVTKFPSSNFGTGCPGTGGLVPTLTLSGSPFAGAQLNLNIDSGLGNGLAFIGVGHGAGTTPIGYGCMLNVAPNGFILLGSFPLNASGSLAASVTIPATTPAVQVALQAFVLDAGVPGGLATSSATLFTVRA